MVLWGEQPPCLQSWVAGTGGSSHTNARGTSRFLSRAGSPFTLQQQQQIALTEKYPPYPGVVVELSSPLDPRARGTTLASHDSTRREEADRGGVARPLSSVLCTQHRRAESVRLLLLLFLLGVRGQVSRDVKSRWLSLQNQGAAYCIREAGATRYSASSILEPPARAGSTNNVADKVGS